ncbi:aspartate racemase [Paenibacillus glycanilyticus]|uniref:Aspartate racemase n=1 Tax=Paenibacillus glycanilyticus TaxID=126569 RepID=A0ABQ6NSF2_9BACL|nr:amino acid racemase [Paenibacillus glycanilyticus]GMK47470.1 aspartate racemase [Paenibacillus glycanilyticus]
MEKGSLGVIGGMGPKATSVFFDRVIEKTDAEIDQNHIDMVIVNHASLPDRTDVLQSNRIKERLFLDAVSKDLVLLQNAGVSNIAVPCNTAHYFYNEMQKITSVPIINMVNETIKVVANKYGPGSRVGVLATNGTINNGIYRNECEALELEFYKPNENIQQRIMEMIYKIKKNQYVDTFELEDIIEELQKKCCHCVIIACTELSCIPLSSEIRRYCVDAMDVLVEQSILRSGKRVIHSDFAKGK